MFSFSGSPSQSLQSLCRAFSTSWCSFQSLQWLAQGQQLQAFQGTPRNAEGGSKCSFPQEWRGRWYQGGLGEVKIREHTISTKGICREHDEEFYMLEDRGGECHRCLLMIVHHPNVIQYKEGYCVRDSEKLHDVCSQIRQENPLFTLVREGSMAVPCPFQDAYFFTYNNNSGGFCREPMSIVRPCASESKFNFHFKHCGDPVQHSRERDLNFECIATWKDGSDTYIYGKFTGTDVLTREDNYRCFLYQSLGQDINMAMSADPSCQGLRSAMDGPMVIQFQRDTVGWSSPGCTFPGWLGTDAWHEIRGKHRYYLDSKSEILRVDSRKKRQRRWHTTMAFRCIKRASDIGNRHFLALTLTSDNCDTTRQCIRIERRHDDVIDIHYGTAKESGDVTCSEADFRGNSTIRHMILPEAQTKDPCPLTGRFQLSGLSTKDCRAHFHVGCNGSSIMGVESNCPDLTSRKYLCVKTWQESKRKYVITRQLIGLGRDDDDSNCFVFEEDPNSYHVYTDNTCSGRSKVVSGEPLRYIFLSSPVSCEDQSYDIHVEPKTEVEDGHSKPGNSKEVRQTTPPTHTSEKKTAESRSVTSSGRRIHWAYCCTIPILILMLR